MYDPQPSPSRLQDRLDATYRIAVEAVEAWLSGRPEVDVADTTLAAGLVVQTIKGVTHRLVIHPRPDHEPDDYAAETVLLLVRYLCPQGHHE